MKPSRDDNRSVYISRSKPPVAGTKDWILLSLPAAVDAGSTADWKNGAGVRRRYTCWWLLV
jgi:hypothetical protein